MPNIFRLGGGDTVKKTLLWTNPNSNDDYGGHILGTETEIEQYDYLVFEYKPDKNSTIIKTAIIKLNKNDGLYKPLYPVGMDNDDIWYFRGLRKQESNYKISNCYKYNYSGYTDSYVIVTKVYGIKGNIAGGGSQ